jgi:hypothetical protein
LFDAPQAVDFRGVPRPDALGDIAAWPDLARSEAAAAGRRERRRSCKSEGREASGRAVIQPFRRVGGGMESGIVIFSEMIPHRQFR